ncbi:related to conserved hypothetical Ustilaginaceae-specific protein [Ustilago sp. UG-2017a]|nr:related to conserved hypothetical Ustilaginaceae-specific protein [Ustilago sp. UG-2017a]
MIRSFNKALPLDLLPPRTGDNNVDMARLLDFVTRLYYPHVDDSFSTQLYISSAIITFLIIPSSIVVLHRLIHGRLWFLKIWPVAGGIFIIPNSIIAFLTCLFCFSCLWISHVFVSVEYYHGNPKFQKSYILWRILIWTPLWLGGWWSGFGILSAFPDALRYERKSRRQRRLILNPMTFNIACWFVPAIQFSTILLLAILAARTYNKTLDDFDAWRQAVDVAEKGRITDATFTMLLAQALDLWLAVTKSFWYYGIAMTCWCCWAAICLLTYLPLGAHTLSRIRSQLQLAKRKDKATDPFFSSRPPVICIQEPTFQERSGQGSKNGFQSTPDVHAAQTRSLCDDMQQSGDELKETEDGLQKSSEGRNDLLEIDERNDATSTSSSRVFPPMKMASVTLPSRPSQYRSLEQRRIHILGRVYRNIGIQYCGVCFAILCFFGSSMVLAAHCYDSARNNTIAINSVVAALTATYPIIIFGFLVVSLIFWRSFDPALSIDVAEDESPFTSTRSTLEKLTKRALRIGKPKGRTIPDSKVPTLSFGVDDSKPHSSLSQASSVSIKELERTHSIHTRVGTGDLLSAKSEALKCQGPVAPKLKQRRGIWSFLSSPTMTRKLVESVRAEEPVVPEQVYAFCAVEALSATRGDSSKRTSGAPAASSQRRSTASGEQAELTQELSEQCSIHGLFEPHRTSNPSIASSFVQTHRTSSGVSISSANTFAAGQRRQCESHASRPESPTLTNGFEMSIRRESFGEAAPRFSNISNRSVSYDLERGLAQYCEHTEQVGLPRRSL